MASVTITHQHPNNEATTVTIDVDAAYPDALDQARAEAVRTLANVLCVLEVVWSDDKGDGESPA